MQNLLRHFAKQANMHRVKLLFSMHNVLMILHCESTRINFEEGEGPRGLFQKL